MSDTHCPYCATLNHVGASRCRQCGATLETAAPLSPGAQLGAYTVKRVLGQGGFGITYLAQSVFSARVAVKEFYPDGLVSRDESGAVIPELSQKAEFRRLLERFVREAEVLWKLEPPFNRYLGFWEQNGTAYLAMQYFQGETLEARLARGEKLSERGAHHVMLEVLELLGAVHAQGLLHRDIKPANIVLTDDRAELIDFGSITDFQRRGVTTRLLTPDYAPLEFYGSDVQLSPASDLYSLCATMYEAVTLVKPPSALERMNGVVLKPVRELEPALSPGFADVLERGLALKVQERHDSATDLRQQLTEQLRLMAAPPVAKKNRVSWGTLAIGLWLGLVVGAAVWFPSKKEPLTTTHVWYSSQQCVSFAKANTFAFNRKAPDLSTDKYYVLDSNLQDYLRLKLGALNLYTAFEVLPCDGLPHERVTLYFPRKP